MNLHMAEAIGASVLVNSVVSTRVGVCAMPLTKPAARRPRVGGTNNMLRGPTAALAAFSSRSHRKRCRVPAEIAVEGPQRVLSTCEDSTFEARLCALLRRLQPEARREVIARRLSQTQRLALEKWMVSSKAAQTESSLPPPSTIVQENGDRTGNGVNRWRVPPVDETKVSRRQRTEIASNKALAAVKKATSGVQVMTKRNRRLYRAQVTVDAFRISSRYDADLKVALSFQEVLADIRERVLRGRTRAQSTPSVSSLATSDDWMGTDVGGRFARAMLESPKMHGLDPTADMGMTFTASIGAACWIGQALTTPRFSVACLEDGLRAWRGLIEARGIRYGRNATWHSLVRMYGHTALCASWTRLRKAYLEMWAQVRSREHADVFVAARLDMLEAKRGQRGLEGVKRTSCKDDHPHVASADGKCCAATEGADERVGVANSRTTAEVEAAKEPGIEIATHETPRQHAGDAIARSQCTASERFSQCAAAHVRSRVADSTLLVRRCLARTREAALTARSSAFVPLKRIKQNHAIRVRRTRTDLEIGRLLRRWTVRARRRRSVSELDTEVGSKFAKLVVVTEV
eukprot:TRINITY_DN11739_c0_g1_i3.p1 TRINITY_DN11739_c0_g1~~TRINITY_DN11739_c0_g1_i3.p1  ORF type:complete len:575 (+),score=79.40 TRINITY_DN11739_c0_g1_i3:256-1980(+)